MIGALRTALLAALPAEHRFVGWRARAMTQAPVNPIARILGATTRQPFQSSRA
jgi:hypothetical protein